MPMTSPTGKDARLWVDASRYDLETAKALLESRRYLYVLFMCQQCLEKLLKAQVMARTVELPPRIHGLVRLAELAAPSPKRRESSSNACRCTISRADIRQTSRT